MLNGVDNRVLTATGTDGMKAEANLTFDGSTLNISGSITGTNATFTNITGNLSNCTNYPASALTGTVENSQIAGPIDISKLENKSVSFGGVTLDLGGSDATPAFDLRDATNYPTGSLTGTIANYQLAGSTWRSYFKTC